MEDDWDLHAVVRSCSATANTTTSAITITATTSSSGSASTSCSNFQPRQDDNNNNNNDNNSLFCFQDLLEQPRILTENGSSSTGFEELHQLCKPFFTESDKSTPRRLLPISPISVLGKLQDLPPSQQQQQQLHHQLTDTRLIQPKRPLSVNGSTPCTLHAQTPRTKRRKNQLKKVCQVAADALSSDTWSWRKYGQKPIKGSPYPRGYYKCSTSKGCLARKQVERNRSDPNMFIVTYTAEHNHPMPTHRNSLAGITRHKTANSNKPTTSSPESSPAINSPAPENQESDIFEEDDDDGVSDVGLDKMEIPGEDFFEGLDDLQIPATGDSLTEKFTGRLQFPWLGNNAATTAAGGS